MCGPSFVCLLFHAAMLKYDLCYRLLNPSLRWYLRDKGSYLTAREEGTFGNLPCATTLKKYKNLIPSKPGINNDFLAWMSSDAKKKSLPKNGWLGGLLVDEMAIQVWLRRSLLHDFEGSL